jgi:hypothetical protein
VKRARLFLEFMLVLDFALFSEKKIDSASSKPDHWDALMPTCLHGVH